MGHSSRKEIDGTIAFIIGREYELTGLEDRDEDTGSCRRRVIGGIRIYRYIQGYLSIPRTAHSAGALFIN